MQHNAMINENIVVPRLVNTQSIEFLDWCARMANGSTVTAADVAAVMQQIENKMLEVLTLNAKICCSPGGLVFRPKVSGSITQSQLKAKLEARKAAETDPEKAAAINVNRPLTTSDLSINDCTVSIEVDLPKNWSTEFKNQAKLKRVSKATASDENTNSGETNTNGTNSETVTAPVISGNTSFVDSTQVTMSAEAGAEIRYTTDGTTPTASSTLYASALTLSDTTTVKAIAIKNGVSSEVTTKVFTKSSGGSGDDAE